MVSVKNLKKINFKQIPIDTYWNSSEEIEAKIHRIHAYPAKFPAFITTKAINYAIENGHKIERISDIFCGCGTTAFEAKRNRIHFWGCDINPVATLIAKVKSQKYNNIKIEAYYKEILYKYQNQVVINSQLATVNERIRYWFHDDQIYDLMKLKKSINDTVSKKSIYNDFFFCAFSNILKAVSKWLTKSIKPQIDPNKNPKEVEVAFSDQIKFMLKAQQEIKEIAKSEVEIETINFLEKKIEDVFVDLIITSPPYVTSYEYADLHQLSTLWLDYANDYRILRQGSIGSLFNEHNFNKDIKYLNSTGNEIVFRLFNVEKRKARFVAKYFVDMQNAISKCYQMLKNNGLALFVIGNTEYKEVLIDNVKHLIESMIMCGFVDIKVTKRKISKKNLTPYRDSIGRFTKNAGNREVYAEEFIVIGKKYEKN